MNVRYITRNAGLIAYTTWRGGMVVIVSRISCYIEVWRAEIALQYHLSWGPRA